MNYSNTSELLKSLEEHYVQGDIDASQKELLSHKESFDAGVFHYNLGTLYLKKNDYAIGRYHLEKAIRKGFINSQVLNNLEFAKSHLKVKQVEAPSNFLDYFYQSAAGVPQSLYTSITLFTLFLIVLAYKFKKLSLKAGLILILIFPVSTFLFAKLVVKEIDFAITLKETEVREGPSSIFDPSRELPAGVKVVVRGPIDGWYLIKSPIILSGWVQAKELGIY